MGAGGSRVLQAIARDKLFPLLGVFGYGTPKGDEPRVAVVRGVISMQI